MYANDATNSGREDVSDGVLFGIVLFCAFQQFGIPTMKLKKNWLPHWACFYVVSNQFLEIDLLPDSFICIQLGRTISSDVSSSGITVTYGSGLESCFTVHKLHVDCKCNFFRNFSHTFVSFN